LSPHILSILINAAENDIVSAFLTCMYDHRSNIQITPTLPKLIGGIPLLFLVFYRCRIYNFHFQL
jgi:hypothetical protein